MTDSSAEQDEFDQLAEAFVESWRHGKKTPIQEYAEAHPKHSERIMRLFPAILLAENMGGSSTGGKRVGLAPPPQLLGEYRIIRELGRGGMGVVYEAVQEPLGRQVALKVLANTGLADPRYRERFQREARAAARLHHTNIVPVYGVGEYEGIHYYAMQYIVGQGMDQVLSDVIRARGQAFTRPGIDQTYVGHPIGNAAAMESTEADSAQSVSDSSGLKSSTNAEYFRGVARVGLQVAEALGYAHDQGVLHRDIKPSNLLMDHSGTVWVTDFGLAKTEDDVGLTGTGDFVGTMRFMAPERFRGESGPACDVYSLGVSLYEMLTFRPAFDDTDRAKLLGQVLQHEPLPPRTIDRRVPRDLETIVLKAMAKEVPARYASAQAMADDLHQFLADRPISARRALLSERAWRWCRRNPIPAALTAGITALALFILIASPIVAFGLYEQRQVALDKLWLANLAQAKAQRLTMEAGRRTLAIQSLDEAQRLLPHLPADPLRRLELRNEFFSCLTLPDLGPQPACPLAPPGTNAVTFDAAFSQYARGDESGAVSIRRLSDDQVLVQLPSQGIPAQALKFSPDGRYLAVGYHHKYQTNSERFRVWNCENGHSVVAVDSETGCGEADFSHDSRYIAFGNDGDNLVIHDLQAPSTPPANHKVVELPTAIAFHPSGARLAVAARRQIEIRERDTGRVLITRNSDRDVWAMAWHPDGQLLATGSGGNISLWQGNNTQPATTLRGHEQVIYGLAFNPDGALLASKSHDGSIRLWDVATRLSLIRTNCVHLGCVPIQFSHDGRQLAFGTDGSSVWTYAVERGHECRWLVVPRMSSSLLTLAGDFTPDGKFLVTSQNDGLRIWNCATGQASALTPVRAVRVLRVAADGNSVFTGSPTELQQWPLIFAPADFPTIGPPVTLSAGEQITNVEVGLNGAVIVFRHLNQTARLTALASPEKIVALGDHPRIKYIAISPDSRSVATGTEFGKNIRIWNAATGELREELPADSSASVAYSPDGKWLAVGTEHKYLIYDAASLRLRHEFAKEPESTAGEISFSRDGKLMLVRHTRNQLRLIDPSAGAELATLRSPGQQIMSWHRISPDGSRVAAGGAGNLAFLWDLTKIRQQLAERDLDW